MIGFLFGRVFGCLKWIPLWSVTNYAGVAACGIYLIFGEELMFAFYRFFWPLTICLLAKPGSQFLFQYYFGLFTNFKIPELVYALAPLSVLAITCICYLNKKHSQLFFLFSLGSVFVTSVIVLVDANLGNGPKLNDFRIITYILAMAFSLSGFSWLIIRSLKRMHAKRQQRFEDNTLRQKFQAVCQADDLQFFSLEQYLIDRRKCTDELLRELDGYLDIKEINTGSNRQLTTIVPFKITIELRTTKVVFEYINQLTQPLLKCFEVTTVLPKINGHDNMGFDFSNEYLPLMKQAIIQGIENYSVPRNNCSKSNAKPCSCCCNSVN